MKILPFTIPVKAGESIKKSHEILSAFYPYYHQHEEIQIIYILQGQGSLLFNNRLIEFKAHSFFVIGANQAHVFKNDPGLATGIETWNIFIDYAHKLKGIFSLPEFMEIRHWLENIGLITIPENLNSHVFQKMQTVLKSNGSSMMIALLSLLEYIMPKCTLVVSRRRQVISENEGSRLNQVIQYIWNHYMETLSLQDCANLMNMQPESFCRYFKKRTNTNFSAYLNEVRIHQACRLLNNNQEIPMGAVAYQCGFNHVTHFNRVFKSIVGTSPSGYKSGIGLLV